MESSASSPSVKCPKCKTSYRLPAGFRGTATCKQCKAAFSVGVPETQKRAEKSRDAADQRTMKTLLIVCGGVLAVVGLIVALTKGGGGAPLDPHYVPPTPAPAPTAPKRPVVPISTHPERVAVSFLRALSRGEKADIERLFDVDMYYLAWDGPGKNNTPDPQRFDRLPKEEQDKRRALAHELIMDPELAQALGADALIKWDHTPFTWSYPPAIGPDNGKFDLNVRDEATKPLVSVTVTVRLRAGKDASADGDKLDSWCVSWVEWRWNQSTLKIAAKDKRAMDPIEERRKDLERKAMAGKPRGPVEADPVAVSEVPGTGPTQKSTIEDSLRVLLDPGSSGPKYHGARDQLINLGRISIPFLLNYLVGKNHADNDEDIKNSFTVIQVLDEITGLGRFGYEPTQAKDRGVGVTTATGEDRNTAVRRWFGWWSKNHQTWSGKPKPVDEEEEDK